MLSNLPLSDIAIVVVAILISMTFHEAMHAFTSHWLGDTTARDAGRLTLNPLKHIDLFTTILLPIVLLLSGLPPIFIARPVPFNPHRVRFDEFGAALIGIAGPLTNFALAALTSLLIRFGAIHSGNSLYNVLVIFIEVNIGFFVFNMIPFPPLDGSRLLYAFAPESVQKVMYQIESMGFLTILFFFFLVFQFLSPVIINIDSHLIHFLLGTTF